MQVAVHTTFAASRKEPLGEVVERVHRAFAEAGLGEPQVQFSMGDHVVAGFTSSVARVLKRFPELARFAATTPAQTGIVPTAIPGRHLSNGPGSPAVGESVPFATLQAIASGVPRSFPLRMIALRFAAPAFGHAPAAEGAIHLDRLDRMRLFEAGGLVPGVLVQDSWWVNGRQRSFSALTFVEAQPGGKKLPPLPQAVAAVLALCGKVRKTVQVPLPEAAPPETADAQAGPSPETLAAVRGIVADFKQDFARIVDRAAMPHSLPTERPPRTDAAPGPLKPALARAFAPLGYDCKGGSGSFTLRRRTPGNLAVEIHLDVGSWSRQVIGFFRIEGLGFKASFPLPVGPGLPGLAQYPIGDAQRWGQIVDNLAALVGELDRSVVPEIERAAGPSPAWFRPEA